MCVLVGKDFGMVCGFVVVDLVVVGDGFCVDFGDWCVNLKQGQVDILQASLKELGTIDAEDKILTEEKFIKEHYYSLKNKVVTITNFVDTEMFVPSINKSNQTTRIVVVGRVSEQKNILRFLKVIKILM